MLTVVADAGPNTTQIIVVVCGLVATIFTSTVTLIVTLRQGGRAREAHGRLAVDVSATRAAVETVAQTLAPPTILTPSGDGAPVVSIASEHLDTPGAG